MSQAALAPDRDVPLADQKEKTGKKQKKQGGAGGILILLLLVILAVGGLVASILFNFFGIRDQMIEALSSLDENYVAYTERAAELDVLSKELDTREEKIATDEARLEKYAQELEERANAIDSEEVSIVPLYRRNLPEERINEFKNLGKIYSNMDAASAAAVMSQLYTVSDMATIVFYMDKQSAADVLAALSDSLAADITMQMLRG